MILCMTVNVWAETEGIVGDTEAPQVYEINYVLNGGNNNAGNLTSYTMETSTFTLKAPAKKGYSFLGWYEDNGFTKKVTQVTSGSYGDKTFYAKWKANSYTVKFYGNGASSGSMSSVKYKYGTTYTLPANKFN